MKHDGKLCTIDAVRDADMLVEILSSGAILPLVVTGSSMLPYLRHRRDTVHLRKIDSCHRGQILFFRRQNGEFVLHRLRRILPDGRYLMNGDAQNWCETITHEQVLAEVILITRNGKTRAPDSFGAKLWNGIWYPTRPIRPLLWKCAFGLRRLFRRGRNG